MNTDVLDELFANWAKTKPDFTPHAYYIKDLDKLIVVTEDCSAVEVAICDTLISLRCRTHEEYGKRNHVGFEVDCIQRFCRINKIRFGRKMDLVQILKKIAEEYTKASPAILEVAIPLVEDYNINSVIF